jgi:hypothetical protein
MIHWPRIECLRGHETHDSGSFRIRLGGSTGYHDFPPIPQRFARDFHMELFDWTKYREVGPWCPGAGVESEAIAELGVWEPRETIVALTVFESADPGSLCVDFGAHVGWYSLLAASSGLEVLAWECDPEPLRLLRTSANLNGWKIRTRGTRIGADTKPLPKTAIRLAKLDIEGAEEHAIRILGPSIRAGLVDHILMEVSPVFADYYPALVLSLISRGYEAYRFHDKALPPHPLEELPRDLIPLMRNVEAEVASWHQESVWFKRVGASW